MKITLDQTERIVFSALVILATLARTDNNFHRHSTATALDAAPSFPKKESVA